MEWFPIEKRSGQGYFEKHVGSGEKIDCWRTVSSGWMSPSSLRQGVPFTWEEVVLLEGMRTRCAVEYACVKGTWPESPGWSPCLSTEDKKQGRR